MSSTLPAERSHVRRGRVVTAVVAAVLLGALLLVWALGGFGYRRDLVTSVAVGTVLTSGPYELAFTAATVQHHLEGKKWEVLVTGTGRTTGDVTIEPPVGTSGFVSGQASGSGEFQPVSSVRLGDGTGYTLEQHHFIPGLPPVAVTLKISFTADPGTTMRLLVFDQEYTTPWVFSDEQGWERTRDASDMLLPLRVLPETKY